MKKKDANIWYCYVGVMRELFWRELFVYWIWTICRIRIRIESRSALLLGRLDDTLVSFLVLLLLFCRKASFENVIGAIILFCREVWPMLLLFISTNLPNHLMQFPRLDDLLSHDSSKSPVTPRSPFGNLPLNWSRRASMGVCHNNFLDLVSMRCAAYRLQHPGPALGKMRGSLHSNQEDGPNKMIRIFSFLNS